MTVLNVSFEVPKIFFQTFLRVAEHLSNCFAQLATRHTVVHGYGDLRLGLGQLGENHFAAGRNRAAVILGVPGDALVRVTARRLRVPVNVGTKRR